MSELVVVAVDGSVASDAAIDWAIARAMGGDAHLELLTIVDMHWTRPVEPAPGLATHERVVFEAGRRVRARDSGVRWSTTVHHDLLVPGLVAASRRADILVMGSHKPIPARGSIHGTLPLVIAARTTSPLVVVPAGWTPSSGPVVVGVDDECGRAALAFAAQEADRARTTLVAVRASDVPSVVSRAWRAAGEALPEVESSQIDLLDEMVSSVRQDHEQLPIAAMAVRGRPAVVLAARARGARLSVVGRRRADASAALLLGPVAHDLLMNLPSPVAVVPEPADQGRNLELPTAALGPSPLAGEPCPR